MNNFRQKQPPFIAVNVRTDLPTEKNVLGNGISIYTINAGTEDLMRVEFVFRAGMSLEDIPLLAGTTNMMLTEGTRQYSAVELNAILDYYGIFLNLYSDKDTAGLTIFFINKHIEKALDLASEIIFNPVFPDKELELLMKKRLGWYRIGREKVHNIANDQFYESVFGPGHPFGKRVKEEDFNKLFPSLLKDYHKKHYRPEKMTAIVSGRIHENTIPLFEKYFGGIANNDLSVTNMDSFIKGSDEKKMYIEKPGALQSAFRIGSTTIHKRHHDYPGLKILNTILGGYFGSRLMKNIREDKGYTYGIHSSVSSIGETGLKVISTEVGRQYREKAAKEIYKEIALLQEKPIGKDELEVVRNYMAGEMVRMFDGPFAIAESFKAVWEYGLDFGYFKKMMETIKTITPDEIMRLANLYYRIEDLYEISAG